MSDGGGGGGGTEASFDGGGVVGVPMSDGGGGGGMALPGKPHTLAATDRSPVLHVPPWSNVMPFLQVQRLPSQLKPLLGPLVQVTSALQLLPAGVN